MREKLTVIKVGGKIVEEEATLLQLLNDFAAISGHKVLVHGGGRSATKIAAQLGIESKMVNGRRITDAETLKVVTMVYGGLVNKNIVAGLQARGVNALGLTGADMNVIRSVKRPVKEVDYGFVGDVEKVDASLLADLIHKGVVPVMAPLTHDGQGNMLNTNADTIAGETAKALSALFDVTLVYCFEKKGVLRDENDDDSVIPEITRTEFEQYVADGVIQGAMIPKLENSFEAINAGKDIALANKETLVTAGHIIMPLAKEKGVSILPVDSEHSAIFQSLQGGQQKALHKILLTASGGPFRGKKLEDLANIQVEDALKHPNWAMGRKITIDSSTMVNKGLEVIEAKWLFGVDVDQIQVVVQPQSIIHSMVEYEDGAVIAQLGTPDMKLPIQYALYYPERRYLPGDRLDFSTLQQITFEQPDLETFYGLKLAFEAGRTGGSLPTVLNAANEKAVALFLDRKIKYLQIPEIIQACMEAHKNIAAPTVEEILKTEQETYEFIKNRW